MYYILRLLETLLFIKVVGCAQRTDDMETVFKGAQGAPYKLSSNGRVVKDKERRPSKAF